MKVHLRATFSTYEWPSDEPDTVPIITNGFTDPRNPWGGLDAEIPEDVVGDRFEPWVAENVEILTTDSMWEAAEFALDFPGGVWDWSESESSMDTRTGVYRSVTLHVQDHQETVFNLMDTIRSLRKAA